MHKAIIYMVITGRAHCYTVGKYIYILQCKRINAPEASQGEMVNNITD